jgi:Cap4 SAVED domain
LTTHHASPEDLERDRQRRKALARQGFSDVARRFPTHPDTRKGNWAEVFLAEYIGVSSSVRLPVYRLRYNPNVEQSMKGDDVLAFDLDSNPVRILVGEAKFRSTPSKQAVEDIVSALTRSHRAGIPVSLQFVADRLFREGQAELGAKVDACNTLFALGRLQLDYIGLLVSDANASTHVRRNTKSSLRSLAVISLGLTDPESTVSTCYEGL